MNLLLRRMIKHSRHKTVIEIKNKQDGTVVNITPALMLIFLFIGGMDMFSKDEVKVITTDGEIDLVVPKYYEGPYEFFDIYLHDTNTYIGNIWCDTSDDYDIISYFGNVGYEITKEYRGNHYALKALRLIKDIMIQKQIKSMIFNIEPHNIYSKNVAKEMGARKVATRKMPSNSTLYTYTGDRVDVYEYKLKKKRRLSHGKRN